MASEVRKLPAIVHQKKAGLLSRLFSFCRKNLNSSSPQSSSFTDKETFIQIIPVITFKGIAIHVPRTLVNFTARYAGDGLWIRESQFFGQDFGSYSFCRVVDRNGVKDQAVFDAYLEQAPKKAYLTKKVK